MSMSDSLFISEVMRRIEGSVGQSFSFAADQPVSGGCISNARILTTSCGKSWFVKSNSDSPKAMFQAEADGLKAMAQTGTIRVPNVITLGQLDSGESFLVLEVIQSGRRSVDFFEKFGRQLAEMHRQGSNHQFGFKADNWIGSSVQLNPWLDDWNEFWTTARLIPQLKMARDNGVSNQKLHRLGDRLVNQIDSILETDSEPPALIHGDLWSGNFLADENGSPMILDPACYYANREAEFGMTKLFGGFPPAFYDAYHEAWPLHDGWQSRTRIYTLYHLLNHLNLFGAGYLSGCVEILEQLV